MSHVHMPGRMVMPHVWQRISPDGTDIPDMNGVFPGLFVHTSFYAAHTLSIMDATEASWVVELSCGLVSGV